MNAEHVEHSLPAKYCNDHVKNSNQLPLSEHCQSAQDSITHFLRRNNGWLLSRSFRAATTGDFLLCPALPRQEWIDRHGLIPKLVCQILVFFPSILPFPSIRRRSALMHYFGIQYDVQGDERTLLSLLYPLRNKWRPINRAVCPCQHRID